MAAQEITETLLSAVRGLEPLIREHADEAERNRRLSQPVVTALAEATPDVSETVEDLTRAIVNSPAIVLVAEEIVGGAPRADKRRVFHALPCWSPTDAVLDGVRESWRNKLNFS